jgi:hypothetical protein
VPSFDAGEAPRRSTSLLDAMGRSALISLSVLIAAACIGLDLWFATARCSVSPPLYAPGIVLGALAQILAVALLMLMARHFPNESIRFQLRGIGVGFFLAFVSAPVLLASLLYSDGIGKERTYLSVGIQCHGPALIPRRGI